MRSTSFHLRRDHQKLFEKIISQPKNILSCRLWFPFQACRGSGTRDPATDTTFTPVFYPRHLDNLVATSGPANENALAFCGLVLWLGSITEVKLFYVIWGEEL